MPTEQISAGSPCLHFLTISSSNPINIETTDIKQEIIKQVFLALNLLNIMCCSFVMSEAVLETIKKVDCHLFSLLVAQNLQV